MCKPEKKFHFHLEVEIVESKPQGQSCCKMPPVKPRPNVWVFTPFKIFKKTHIVTRRKVNEQMRGEDIFSVRKRAACALSVPVVTTWKKRKALFWFSVSMSYLLRATQEQDDWQWMKKRSWKHSRTKQLCQACSTLNYVTFLEKKVVSKLQLHLEICTNTHGGS